MSKLTTASRCREEGKSAFQNGKSEHPYDPGSLEQFCWQAGYFQDTRSPEQLVKAWSLWAIEAAARRTRR